VRSHAQMWSRWPFHTSYRVYLEKVSFRVSVAGFKIYTVAMSHVGPDFTNVHLVRLIFFAIGRSDEFPPKLVAEG
jgi:hypothetical protein